MSLLYGILILFSKYISGVYSHAKMVEPPSRSTMWRYGFNTPINYDDNQLYCGGYRRTVLNNGKCGVCGDPYDGPFENEAGGKFATGTIVRRYSDKDRFINITIDVSAHHMGYFQFKICPHNNVKERVKQACFDNYPLKIIHGKRSQNSAYRYFPYRKGEVHMRVEIPEGLKCSQCVLQWHYTTGNFWGVNPDGTSCRGCGPQEQFVNCADISIGFGTADNNQNKMKIVFKNETKDHTNHYHMHTYSPPKSLPLPQHNNTLSATSTSKQECNRCYALPTWRHYPKMDDWCDENCKLGNCPPCRCFCGCPNIEFVNPCSSKGDKAGPELSKWCWRECCENDCPEDKCECNGNVTDHTMSIYDVKKQFFIAGLLYTHNIDQNETIKLFDKMAENPGSTPKPKTKLRLYSTKVTKEHIVIPTAVSKHVKMTASVGRNGFSSQEKMLRRQFEYDEEKGTFSSNVEAKLLDLLKPRNHTLSQIKVYSHRQDDNKETRNLKKSYAEPEPEGLAILMHEVDTHNTKIQYHSDDMSNLTRVDIVKAKSPVDKIDSFLKMKSEKDIIEVGNVGQTVDAMASVTTTESKPKDSTQVEKSSSLKKMQPSFTTPSIPTPPAIIILPSPPSSVEEDSYKENEGSHSESNNRKESKAKETLKLVTTTVSNSNLYVMEEKTNAPKPSYNGPTTEFIPSPPPPVIVTTIFPMPKTSSKPTTEKAQKTPIELDSKIKFTDDADDIQDILNAKDWKNEKVHFEKKDDDLRPVLLTKSTSESLDGLSLPPPPPPPPTSFSDDFLGTDVSEIGSDELTITKNWNGKNLTGVPLDKTNENIEHIINVQKIEPTNSDDDESHDSVATATSATSIFDEHSIERRRNQIDVLPNERVKIFFDVPDPNEIATNGKQISGSSGIVNPWLKNTFQLFNEEIKMIEENVLNFKNEQDSITNGNANGDNNALATPRYHKTSMAAPINDDIDRVELADLVSSTISPFLKNSDDIGDSARGLADLIEDFENNKKSTTASSIDPTAPTTTENDLDIFTTTPSPKTTVINKPTKSLTLNYMLQFTKTIDIQKDQVTDATHVTSAPSLSDLFRSADDTIMKDGASEDTDKRRNLADLINKELTAMHMKNMLRRPDEQSDNRPPLERLRNNGVQILDMLTEARKIKKFQPLPDDLPENSVILDLELMNNILELFKTYTSSMNIVVVE